MKLDPTQEQKVREWIEQGLKVAEVQSRLAAEFDLRLTYMEARFLLDDLRLRPKDHQPAAALPAVGLAPAGPAANPPPPGKPAAGPPPSPKGPGGRVSVSMDQLTRAGALASGRVTFRDGQTAEWSLDQLGRLGLSPQTPGYKATQEDLLDFQDELQSLLARSGF